MSKTDKIERFVGNLDYEDLIALAWIFGMEYDTSKWLDDDYSANIDEIAVEIIDKMTKALVKTKRFKPPTPQEVTDYAKHKGFQLDGEQFCDFYESKGWLVGRVKMKCWKSAVTGTWRPRAKQVGNKTKFLSIQDQNLDDNIRAIEEL